MKTKSLFLTLLALVAATGLTAKVKKIGMLLSNRSMISRGPTPDWENTGS